MSARGDSPEARAMLSELCEAYWMPVYRFLRREGRNEDESRELAQAFFAHMLKGNSIDGADPNKGRFRSYLLGALKHFLSDRRRAERALKRGGDLQIESIDAMEAGEDEGAPGMQIADPGSEQRDTYFDHQWALAVLERGLAQVKNEMESSGKIQQFDVLKPWLNGGPEAHSQAEAAATLNMTPGAVKVVIHRLRNRLSEAVRAEIAQTVDKPEEVTTELRYLIEVLS